MIDAHAESAYRHRIPEHYGHGKGAIVIDPIDGPRRLDAAIAKTVRPRWRRTRNIVAAAVAVVALAVGGTFAYNASRPDKASASCVAYPAKLTWVNGPYGYWTSYPYGQCSWARYEGWWCAPLLVPGGVYYSDPCYAGGGGGGSW